MSADMSSRHDEDHVSSVLEHKRDVFLVGGLSCLAICTGANISLSVSMLTPRLHAPTERHLALAKLVPMIISCTTDKTRVYQNTSTCCSPLSGFADVDCVRCKDTNWLTTWNWVKVTRASVFCTSSQHSIVPFSSAQVEYVVFSLCAKELVSMRKVFEEKSHL